VRSEIEDHRDVRMIECRGGARLRLKPCQ
jgi:hypothetical protein